MSSCECSCLVAIHNKHKEFYSIFLLSFATRAGSQQQHVPTTAGPYCPDMLILLRKGNQSAG